MLDNHTSSPPLGDALKIARIASGFSITETAKFSGISASHLYTLEGNTVERNTGKHPSLAVLAKVCSTFSMSVDGLLTLSIQGVEAYVVKYFPKQETVISSELPLNTLIAIILWCQLRLRFDSISLDNQPRESSRSL